MTTTEYRAVLASLGLRTSDDVTQACLGLSRRQLIRIHQGYSPVPGPLALLLEMYQQYGLPE